MNKVFKYYFIIFLADLLVFYGFIMSFIVEMYDLNKDAYSYILLAAAGAFLSSKYSLKMRQKEMIKSIYFSVAVLFCGLTMYLYYFIKYKMDFFDFNWETLLLVVILIVFVYKEYTFRVHSLDKLEKNFK